jgi:3-oxoacyl-[acyl-carrier protein] reductase
VDLGLKGRACAVTGASRGIGRATARMLCAEGADVLLIARSEDDLIQAADECAAAGHEAGGRAESLVADVTDPNAAERIVKEAGDRLGQLDVLVNNAGAARRRDFDDVPDEDWYAAWELNVMAPLRAMRAAIPGMAERGWGRVVNVASTAAKRPSANMAEYSVAKAAELSLSRLFADRHAGDGVLVNAICPGPTKSEMWMEEGGLLDQSQSHAGHDTREEALDAAGAKRPIGRLAEVDEVAAAIVFLCSERASYVAGAAWSVDGGTVQVII